MGNWALSSVINLIQTNKFQSLTIEHFEPEELGSESDFESVDIARREERWLCGAERRSQNDELIDTNATAKETTPMYACQFNCGMFLIIFTGNPVLRQMLAELDEANGMFYRNI